MSVKKSQSNNKKSSKSRKKLHLGIDKHGNINLIRGKTTNRAKKLFVVKSLLFVGSIGFTAYITSHPDTIERGRKAVESLTKNTSKATKKSEPVMSGIFSKTLGRELTLREAFEAGFNLSD